MNANHRLLTGIALTLLFQLGALGWMIWGHAAVLQQGEEIVFDVRPRDPRNLFLGHYLVLRLPISNSVPAALRSKDLPETGAFVHIVFEKQGEEWKALSIHDRQPDVPHPQIALRARLGRGYQLSYGIERYYLPEKDAKELEQKLRAGELKIVVAVLKETGRVAIKRLLVDGQPRYEDPLF